MKHILFLSLWATGVLGSRCRPSIPPVESSGAPGSSSSESRASQYETSSVDATSGVTTSTEDSGYYPPPESGSSWSGSQSFASESTSWLPGHTPSSQPASSPSFDSSSVLGNSDGFSYTSTPLVPGSDTSPSQTNPPSGTASGSETYSGSSGPSGSLSEGASTPLTSAQVTPEHPGGSGSVTRSGTTGVPVNTPSSSSRDDTTAAGPSASVSTSEGSVSSQSGIASSGQPESTQPGNTQPGNNTPGATLSSQTTPGNTLQSLTSTMTEPPAGFSPTTVSNHPEWTTNTWITTTSGDSSESTIVPVLVGCPLCGGSGSGIVIFGFPPFINTLFKFPGFPKFSFPCIPPGCSTPPTTEGEPDDSDDTSKSDEVSSATSSTCTEEVTASDCLVACTTYTGPADASATPECTTTCTKTHTGCSVTGVTSTTSAEACSATGDGACDYCGVVSTSEDPDNLERRDLERRVKASPRKEIGGCLMNTPPKFPEYPGGEGVLTNDALIVAGTPLFVIERWWMTTRSGCVPTLKGPEPASQYHSNIKLSANVPSIDHVYEKSWLTDFFSAIVNSTSKSNVHGLVSGPAPAKLTCDDLQYYSDDLTGTNLLQTIFDTYPGAKANPKNKIMVKSAKYLEDFIGMDQWTNGDAKGYAGTPSQVAQDAAKHADVAKRVSATTSYTQAKTWVDNKLNMLERIGIGMEMMSQPSAIAAMKRQNQRIYSRLLDLDSNARTCKSDPAVTNSLWSFAREYQTFTNNRFAGTTVHSINYVVGNAKNTLIAELTTDLAAAKTNNNVPAGAIQVWQDRLNNMQKASRVWEVTITWDWTFVAKRDESDISGDSCPLPSQTLTTLSTVVSKSQTSDSETESATTSDSRSTSDSNTVTSSVRRTSTKTTATTASASASATSSLVLCTSDDDCKDIACEKEDEVSGCTTFPEGLNIDNFCVCGPKAEASTSTSDPPVSSPTAGCDYYPRCLPTEPSKMTAWRGRRIAAASSMGPNSRETKSKEPSTPSATDLLSRPYQTEVLERASKAASR
ncbi:hypothetical protein B0J13DRAFT_477205 [Dactylonectria estremocensis]|uniref:Uncharacterized protein n=1 Tax=Dactylonectria estremocensis TaxID=1079267 RepID=A0A9P9EMH9_9HYPO|nr:hypothetical protein B0J13DRAFT_477205 [Dactylonectria estremocensis]